MTTLEIQRRLKALAFDPGPLDGAMGPKTRLAIRQFQSKSGLAVDGVVGPETSAALFPPKALGAVIQPVARPPWYLEAERLRGTDEVRGSGNSSVIMGWAQKLGLWYPNDATAWCGLFVAHCIGVALPDEPQPSNPLGARNWAKFGVACSPVIGAVLVFSRPGSSWSGHVGFYAGESAGAFAVLGGNQSDSVTVTNIAKSRLLGVRWPKSVPVFGVKTVVAAGKLSTNEA
jgi:uncharacterized protein (TIGR02594 family)